MFSLAGIPLRAMLFFALVVADPNFEPDNTNENRTLLLEGAVADGIGTWNELTDWAYTKDWSTVLWLARHWHRIRYCAPPEDDIKRLPSLDVARDNVHFGQKYREFLAKQEEIEPVKWRRDWYDATLSELNDMMKTWDTIWDCRIAESQTYNNGYPSGVSYKRAMLLKLLDRIGPPNYYAGDWGPWVPIWHFRQID